MKKEVVEMRTESVDLLLSFLALLCIPCVIVIASYTIRRIRSKSSAPRSEIVQTCAISAVITVVITLAISFILKVTGFFNQQFYRPSARDYGVQTELGIEPESFSFSSIDGTKLHGWFLNAAGDAAGTIICFHGSDRNITHTTRNVYWLTQCGFNVFVFDYRGYGKSDGKPTREGLVEDSVAAIEAALTRSDVRPDRIVLYGQSMGGQLALNAASLRKDIEIQLVIAEATYARQSYHLSDKVAQIGPLWLIKWACWLLTSDTYSGEDAIANLPATPVLLIHGTADVGVRPYHSERLYQSATGSKEIWRYEGKGHLQIFKDNKSQERLATFIKAHLPQEPVEDQEISGDEDNDEHDSTKAVNAGKTKG